MYNDLFVKINHQLHGEQTHLGVTSRQNGEGVEFVVRKVTLELNVLGRRNLVIATEISESCYTQKDLRFLVMVIDMNSLLSIEIYFFFIDGAYLIMIAKSVQSRIK